MILGDVRPGREAVITIALSGTAGNAEEFDATIDTGFTDYLTIPPTLVERLGLRYRESMSFELANGQLAAFDLYEASVLWDDTWREIIVAVADGGPLIGMALLHGFRLNIEVIDGGRVEITRL